MQIESPDNNQTNISGLIPGNTYAFSWNLANAACDTFSTDTITVIIVEDDEQADAGGSFLDCGNGNLTLMATIPDSGTGTWSSPHSELTFTDTNAPDTEVQGLESGIYTFIWTLDKGDCGQTADTIEVEYEEAPVAIGDEIEVSFARTATFDVLVNDQIPASGGVVVLEDFPAHGNLRNSGDGNFVYDPDPVFCRD